MNLEDAIEYCQEWARDANKTIRVWHNTQTDSYGGNDRADLDQIPHVEIVGRVTTSGHYLAKKVKAGPQFIDIVEEASGTLSRVSHFTADKAGLRVGGGLDHGTVWKPKTIKDRDALIDHLNSIDYDKNRAFEVPDNG